ncbi:MAG: hypothetical protein IKY26_04540 [Erysipelotrichaceae bacterium]|nr:hypothetical protein [Erysipelotrichaceae bacterium]
MEMNTVLLSVDKYNELLLENQKNYIASFEKGLEIDELEEKCTKLSYLLIEKCINEYCLDGRTLEELTDIRSITFAIDKGDYNRLINSGISHHAIVYGIRKVKERYDAKQRGEE